MLQIQKNAIPRVLLAIVPQIVLHARWVGEKAPKTKGQIHLLLLLLLLRLAIQIFVLLLKQLPMAN